MSKAYSENTTGLGIPENRIMDTENMNIPLVSGLCRKLYKFTIYHSAKVGHFEFYPQCDVISDHNIRSGIFENPIADTKILHLLLFSRKLYQFKV